MQQQQEQKEAQDQQNAQDHNNNGQAEVLPNLSTIESYQSYINQITQALEQSGQFTSSLRFNRYEQDDPQQKEEDEQETQNQEQFGEQYYNKNYGEQAYEQIDRTSDNQQETSNEIDQKENQLNPFCLHTIEEEEDQQHEEEVDLHSKEPTEINSSPMKSNPEDYSEQYEINTPQLEFSGEKENNQYQRFTTSYVNANNNQDNLDLEQHCSDSINRVDDDKDQGDFDQIIQDNIDNPTKQFVFIQGNKYHFMTIDSSNQNSAQKQNNLENSDDPQREIDLLNKEDNEDNNEQDDSQIEKYDEVRQIEEPAQEEDEEEEEQHGIIADNTQHLKDFQDNDIEFKEGQLKEKMIVDFKGTNFENMQSKNNKNAFKGYLKLAQIHQQNKRQHELIAMQDTNQVNLKQTNLIKKPKANPNSLQLDEWFPDSPWNQFKVSDIAASKLSQREESVPEVFDLFSAEEIQQTNRYKDQSRFAKLNELIQDKLRKETVQYLLKMRQSQDEYNLKISNKHKIQQYFIDFSNNNFNNTNRSTLPLNENFSHQLSNSDPSKQLSKDQFNNKNIDSIKLNNQSDFKKPVKQPTINICSKDKIEQMTKDLARQLEIKSSRKLESTHRMHKKEEQIKNKGQNQEICLKPKRISSTSRGSQRSFNSSQYQTSRLEEIDYRQSIIPSNKRDKKNQSEISNTSSSNSFKKMGINRLTDKHWGRTQEDIMLVLNDQGSFNENNKQQYPQVKLKTLMI